MKEIRKIIETYDAIDHSVEKVALAAVVNVEASAYRRIGARMLVRSNGLWIGGISGGCLEGDALKRSQVAIFKNRPSSVVYDTMEDDNNQIGVGLGCNGRIEVLFTPIDPADKENDIEQLRKLVAMDEPAVLLKVIAGDLERLGKSLLVASRAVLADFCGLDEKWLQTLVDETMDRKQSKVRSPLNNSEIKILSEFIRPETRLVIVGDNYDVNAFVGIADELGWEIFIVGKKKKLSKAAFKIAKKVVEYAEVGQLEINEYTAVVLMTHDYNWDLKMINHFLPHSPPYLGMLGPKKRMLKMQDEMPGVNLSELLNLFSPVGLDIGAESPEEIALSIAAEIVSNFRKRPGTFLRQRKGSIHSSE